MVRQIALFTCILLAAPLRAHEVDPNLIESIKPPSWEIAPEVSHFTYREPGVMKDEGTFYGIVGSYTRRRLQSGDPAQSDIDSNDLISWSTLKIEGRFSFGEVEYDGAYMDGTPLRMSGTDDFLLDIRLMWGREWQPATFFNAFYAGLGYRYLNDDSSSQPGGYLRQSNYLYLPLGTGADFELKDGWSLGLTGEFDLLLFGRQISHLDDVDPRYPKVENWQWPGFGLRGAVALRHRSQSLDVAFSPFVRYWWIAESDVSNGYYEPENNTLEYGMSAIFRF
jgi:hypothetical protein